MLSRADTRDARYLVRTLFLVAAHVAILPFAAAAQTAAQPDPLLAEVDEVLKQARRDIEQFEQGGGKKDDARHPVTGWVAKLWAYRERHPGTPAAGKATAQAIHLLVHTDRFKEVEARADGLAAGDPAWQTLPDYLSEAAAAKKDYSYLVRKLGDMAPRQSDAKVRARLNYCLGRGQAKAGKTEAARVALRSAISDAAGTPLAKDAASALYELDNLVYGQAAPVFAGPARGGSSVALADLRGRVVLLVFWAST